jgi:hypothetical protein
MTPVKLSAAVSHANKLGQDALCVTLVQSEANRAIGPMAAIGWQVNLATIDRSVPARGMRTTVTFSRVAGWPSLSLRVPLRPRHLGAAAKLALRVSGPPDRGSAGVARSETHWQTAHGVDPGRCAEDRHAVGF